MKVGLLVRYWPTLSETFVAREVAALGQLGVEVAVMAIGHRADSAWADRLPDVATVRPPAIPATAMAELRRPAVARAARWLLRHQPAKNVLRALWVGQVARRCGWQRIHVHFAGEAAEWARVAAVVAQVPFSVTVHATDLYRPRAGLTDVLRSAEPVVTVAEAHARHIRQHHGVSSEVVRCGVELERFEAARPDQPGRLRLVCVARDVPKKGLDGLVAAVAEVDGAHLRLVSDAHRLARPGVVVGSVRPSRLPRVLAAGHAFVLPCRVAPDGDRDGVPVSLIEAMAAGLPVITTAVAGIPELVDDRVGWLVPPDDPAALVGALREAAASPTQRRSRGEAGRRRVHDRNLTVRAQAAALLHRWRVAGCRSAGGV